MTLETVAMRVLRRIQTQLDFWSVDGPLGYQVKLRFFPLRADKATAKMYLIMKTEQRSRRVKEVEIWLEASRSAEQGLEDSLLVLHKWDSGTARVIVPFYCSKSKVFYVYRTHPNTLDLRTTTRRRKSPK